MKNKKLKITVKNINKILHTYWDPIGCGVPLDEYLRYAKTIYLMLNQGCSETLVSY